MFAMLRCTLFVVCFAVKVFAVACMMPRLLPVSWEKRLTCGHFCVDVSSKLITKTGTDIMSFSLRGQGSSRDSAECRVEEKEESASVKVESKKKKKNVLSRVAVESSSGVTADTDPKQGSVRCTAG